ncbi:hypothetical protein T484DRAFT_1786605 [Baffinella frigidus]|nr:hypothetical protein T484DRAFT_1786605 [Cryptophyta sp. CCMP2293]
MDEAEAAEDGIEANAYPRAYARYAVRVDVAMGSLTLVENGWGRDDAPARELCYAQFDILDLMYEIRRDTYRYVVEIEAFRMDDRQNLVAGLSSIASCRAGTGGEKLIRWDWDTLATSDDKLDGGTLDVLVDGIHLVYSVEACLQASRPTHAFFFIFVYLFWFVPKEVYLFWFVPKENRFPAHAPPDDTADIEEQVDGDSELRLWEDRTRYDKRLKWEIVFQNPSILFPADHKAADEPVIVFDLDTLRWGSSEAESPYFDRNTARLSRTRFRLVDDIGAWLHCTANGRAPGLVRDLTLAEDFDWTLQVSLPLPHVSSCSFPLT